MPLSNFGRPRPGVSLAQLQLLVAGIMLSHGKLVALATARTCAFLTHGMLAPESVQYTRHHPAFDKHDSPSWFFSEALRAGRLEKRSNHGGDLGVFPVRCCPRGVAFALSDPCCALLRAGRPCACSQYRGGGATLQQNNSLPSRKGDPERGSRAPLFVDTRLRESSLEPAYPSSHDRVLASASERDMGGGGVVPNWQPSVEVHGLSARVAPLPSGLVNLGLRWTPSMPLRRR